MPLLGTVPINDLPLPPESRLLLGGPTPPAPVAVPPAPAPRVVTHPSDPRATFNSLRGSPSFAGASQSLPWIKALVVLLILYRVVSFLIHARHLFR